MSDIQRIDEQLLIKIFGIKLYNPYVTSFLDFVDNSPDCDVEMSRKVVGNDFNQSRLTIGLHQNLSVHIIKVLTFLNSIKEINTEPLIKFFLQSDPRQLQLIVFGVEMGTSPSTTRYKIHLQYYKHPRLIDTVMNHPESNSKSFNFLTMGEITVGFDLFLDGRTEYRTYVSFTSPQQYKMFFEKFYEPHIVDAMYSSENLWLAWKYKHAETFIYFINDNLDPIIDNLCLKGLNREMLDFEGIKPYIFGTTLTDLQRRELTEYNVYFLLA